MYHAVCLAYTLQSAVRHVFLPPLEQVTLQYLVDDGFPRGDDVFVSVAASAQLQPNLRPGKALRVIERVIQLLHYAAALISGKFGYRRVAGPGSTQSEKLTPGSPRGWIRCSASFMPSAAFGPHFENAGLKMKSILCSSKKSAWTWRHWSRIQFSWRLQGRSLGGHHRALSYAWSRLPMAPPVLARAGAARRCRRRRTF